MPEVLKEQNAETVFALDIGTRSIIGMLGRAEKGRFFVEAIEKEEHGRRAMLDGQIVEIEQVAQVAREVIDRLEQRTGVKLNRVCVAAAGRALKTQSASFTLSFDELRQADEDLIGQLEAGAVSEAEKLAAGESAGQGRFYMVGYTARQYVVDGYPMTNLMAHRGQVFEADVVSTFLPSGVVESLYAVTSRLGLEVSSLTLEPIAALNAAIPADIRLLNLVLVDIGAGTSDIAVCREGSVVGYTMATVAGDEITELIMRGLLVDFKTAERLKMGLGSVEPLQYPDILGLKHEITSENLSELIRPAAQKLAKEISQEIIALNGGVPSAIFLAGGGSKLQGLTQLVAGELEMSEARVALAGNHFGNSAWSEEYELNDPEFATPLGIGVSAALGMINDSYMVTLNDLPAKLFRNGTLNLRDVLLMNGFHYGDMMGRTGANLSFILNGKREFLRGMPGVESKMAINGQPAEFTTLVRAGDRIEFTPAKFGRSASVTLAQLAGEDYLGEIIVNGQPQPLDYSVRQGDEIIASGVSLDAHRATGSLSQPEAGGKSQVKSGVQAESLSLAKRQEKTAPKPMPVPAPVDEPKSQPPVERDKSDMAESFTQQISEPAAKPVITPAIPQKSEPSRVVTEEKSVEIPTPATPRSQAKPTVQRQHAFAGIQVVLNGKPIRLLPKAEGGDFFLMDLLEYSGLDFSHLERPVDLLVNGVEGQFSQILRPNDQVVIRYREDS